jgi:hypothetical protein
LGCAMGWLRWVACTRLGFHALLRPGEFLSARRADLILPEDLCRDARQDPRLYVHIGSPKTKATGAKQQHGRSTDPDTCRLWCFLAAGADRQSPLWQGSPAQYRAKWNRICKKLNVPFTEITGVTPASLRGGGATALFEETEDTETVRYRGRWQSMRMCETYVQEVGGHRFLASLDAEDRNLLHALAEMQGEAIELAITLLTCGIPPSDFATHYQPLVRRTHRKIGLD